MKKRKLIKVLLIIFCIIIVIAIVALVFVKTWPAFGRKASKEEREDYAKRASNFDGSTFKNEHDFSVMDSFFANGDNGVISTKSSLPKEKLITAKPEISNVLDSKEISVTWLGHSSLFIQMNGMNILIDPVFSERTSPVSFVGSKRFSDCPISADELPEIDVVIISHDHYDHLDYNTIRDIDSKVKQYVVPLGIENSLERWNVSKDKITNMAWWEETTINGLTIGCTPARHYSGRSIDDRFASLWASWVLKDANHMIYESGDSGYDTHYEEIHERYGDFDFVLMDCAQYDSRWPSVHQTPEQAFTAVKMLGAKYAMPIHWGAFRLASHPWDDSAVRLVKAAQGSDVLIATPMLGETMNLNEISNYQTRWYEGIE